MTDLAAAQYMQKIEAQLVAGTLTPAEALQRAYALGCETERMEAMHQACKEYSRALQAREALFNDKRHSSQPPPRK